MSATTLCSDHKAIYLLDFLHAAFQKFSIVCFCKLNVCVTSIYHCSVALAPIMHIIKNEYQIFLKLENIGQTKYIF